MDNEEIKVDFLSANNYSHIVAPALPLNILSVCSLTITHPSRLARDLNRKLSESISEMLVVPDLLNNLSAHPNQQKGKGLKVQEGLAVISADPLSPLNLIAWFPCKPVQPARSLRTSQNHKQQVPIEGGST